MIIKKVVVENFRQFYGKQQIDFNLSNPNKNVTVIIGGNGTGKTTLNQAFIYCIYGLEYINLPDFDPKKVDNLNELKKLCNDKKWNEKADFDLSVRLVFEHNEKEYDISRTYHFYWGNLTQKYLVSSEIFSGQTIEPNGILGTEKCDQYVARRILPVSLSNLFFFDGERMNKLATKDASDVLSNNVIDILGLRTLRNTLRILKRNDHSANQITSTKTVEYLLRKELVYAENNQNDLNESINKIESDIEELKTKKLNLINKKIKFEEDSKEKLSQIKSLSADKEKQKRREKLIEENKNLSSRIINERKKINELFSNSFVSVLSLKFSNLIKKVISSSISCDRDIIGINSSAIDRLLQRKKCLCNTPLIKGTEVYNSVEEWKSFLPPQDLSTLLINMKNEMNDMVEDAEQFTRKFNNFKEEILEYQSNISDNEIEIEQIKYDNIKLENLNELEEELDSIVKAKQDIVVEISKIDLIIENKEKELKNLKYELEKITINLNVNSLVYKKIDLLERIYKIIEDECNRREQIAQKVLQKEASQNYENMLEKDYKIKLNEDYSYDVYDNDNYLKTTVLSEGERVITSFAFIGALVKTAKALNKGLKSDDSADYPLVMDAPFAKVDHIHRANVANLIPTFSSQIIILSIDSQWEGAIENSMKSNVSNIVYLNYDEATKSTYFEQKPRKKVA